MSPKGTNVVQDSGPESADSGKVERPLKASEAYVDETRGRVKNTLVGMTPEQIAAMSPENREKATVNTVAEKVRGFIKASQYELAYQTSARAAERFPLDFLWLAGYSARKLGKYDEAEAAILRLEELLGQDPEEISQPKRAALLQHCEQQLAKVRQQRAEQREFESNKTPVRSRLISFEHDSPIFGKDALFDTQQPDDVNIKLEDYLKNCRATETVTEADMEAFRKINSLIRLDYPDNAKLRGLLDTIGETLRAKEGEPEVEPEEEKEEVSAPEVKATLPERPGFKAFSSLSEGLKGAMAEAADSEELKDRLQDLWEVAEGNGAFEDAGLTEEVRRMMKEAEVYSRKKGYLSYAVNRLKDALKTAENGKIELIEAETRDRDRLKARLLQLSKTNPKLKKTFAALFEILELKLDDDDENAYALRGMQEDIRTLLLEEIPEGIGVEKCESMADLLKRLEMGRKKQREVLEKLDELVAKDQGIAESIKEYREMTGQPAEAEQKPKKKKEKNAEPPQAPPAAGGFMPPTTSVFAVPPSAPATEADADEEPDEDSDENAEEAPEAPGRKALRLALKQQMEGNKKMASEMLERLGFDAKERTPTIRAIMKLLSGKNPRKEVPTIDFEELEAFLKNLDFMDEADKLMKEELSALEQEKNKLEGELFALHEKLKKARKKYQKNGTEEDLESMNAISSKLAELQTKKSNYTEAIKRKRKGQLKETIRYRTPEQLLGAIKLYFATHEAKAKGETPDHLKVMQETQEDLAKARKRSAGWGHRLVGEVFGGILKPRTTTTLRAIVTRDEALKDLVKPEQATALAKCSNDSQVLGWIRKLGNKEQAMTEIVPRLIGYLDMTVNAGRISYLNTFSLARAKNLAAWLREATHKHALEKAETTSGKGIDKMNAYFAHLKKMNENQTQISMGIVRWHLAKTVGRKTLAPVTLAAGAMAGLAAIPLVGATAAGITGSAALGHSAETDEKRREGYRRGAYRALATTGVLGASLFAGPAALALAPAALMSPEIVKHWKGIKSGAAKGAKLTGKAAVAGAKLTGKALSASPGAAKIGLLTAGVIAGVGFPLIFQRYRQAFFG